MNSKLKQIGVVRNNIEDTARDNWQKVVSKIVIYKRYEEALDHIEGFSHIIVVYWMSFVPERKRSVLKVHPRGKQYLPLVGVFASRSPMRPNPLGITTAKIIERNGNILKVAGLDAMNRTPIIDIKPYIPGYDSPASAKMPEWMKKIH